MRKSQLLTLAWALIWVGSILLIACVLTSLLFQFSLSFITFSVVMLAVGLAIVVISGRRK